MVNVTIHDTMGDGKTYQLNVDDDANIIYIIEKLVGIISPREPPQFAIKLVYNKQILNDTDSIKSINYKPENSITLVRVKLVLKQPKFEWIDVDDKTRIMITKRTGEKIELQEGDLFNITMFVLVNDMHVQRYIDKNIILKVVNFGVNHREIVPTYIYCSRWSESKKEWVDMSKLSTRYNQDSIDSITKTTTDPSLHKKGGRRMRLKSRKCSSKKSRRITRRR
jgi:hypothetical protein